MPIYQRTFCHGARMASWIYYYPTTESCFCLNEIEIERFHRPWIEGINKTARIHILWYQFVDKHLLGLRSYEIDSMQWLCAVSLRELMKNVLHLSTTMSKSKPINYASKRERYILIYVTFIDWEPKTMSKYY